MISIIIPHLNQEAALTLCLAALGDRENLPREVEIIVVDNGSRCLLETLCAGHAGVILTSEATPGPGPARSRGAALARGDILAFIDADCVAHPGWLAAIARRMAEGGRRTILGGDVRIMCVDPDNPTLLECYEGVFAYRMEEYIRNQGFTGTGNLAMHRDTFARVGPFSGLHIAEDVDWGQRSGRLGYTITYAPDMIVYHPARKTFGELRAKWDRHTAHAFQTYGHGLTGRLKWLAYAFAVALSPLAETVRILRSNRIAGLRARWLAFLGVLRIRLYRARLMLALACGKDPAALSGAWNRGPDSGEDAPAEKGP